MTDIIIIGAGPAGLTAAIYARRAGKSVIVIEKASFGGQVTSSPLIENFPAFGSISGNDFAERLVEQAIELGTEIELDTVTAVKTESDGLIKTVVTESGEYNCKSVIIAAGAKHRHLGLPDEERLTGAGISYCAVCDGAFFKGMNVGMVGGGNTAIQEAILLSKTCKSVTVIQNLASLTGEEKPALTLKKASNVKIIYNTVVTKLTGDDALKSVTVKNTESGEISELALDGLFIAIGFEPDNGIYADIVKLDKYGYIEAGEDCETGTAGIFAAGDCRTKRIRQITTAAADGTIAALGACRYIDATS